MFELTPFKNGFNEVNRLFNEINRLFESSFPVNHTTISFRTDVKETDKKYIIEAELPGVKKEDVRVHYEDKILTIEVENNVETETKNKQEKYIHRERHYGKYARSFRVDNVDEDKITAKYDNGVLTLDLPKIETKKKKTINIK